LESYQIPKTLLESPKSEEELDVHLLELKSSVFISPTIHTFASTFVKPEDTISIYTNPLFETGGKFEP